MNPSISTLTTTTLVVMKAIASLMGLSISILTLFQLEAFSFLLRGKKKIRNKNSSFKCLYLNVKVSNVFALRYNLENKGKKIKNSLKL